MNRRKRILAIGVCFFTLIGMFGALFPELSARPTSVFAQTGPSCGVGSWDTSYYNNTNLAGSPLFIGCTPSGQLNGGLFWGTNPPAGGIPADNYSGSFTTNITFPTAGTYRFTAVFQDNARLFINGALTSINFWGVDLATPQTQYADFTVPTANTTVNVKLDIAKFTGTGQISLNWLLAGSSTTPTAPVGNPWSVEYFNNRTFTAPSIIGPSIPAGPLALDWQFSAPAGGVQHDEFSSRFTRVVNFPTGGVVTFTARGDDTVTVRVDGAVVTASAPYFVDQPYTGSISLTPGNHTIVVEHTDIVAQAYIYVSWAGGGDTSGGGTGTGTGGSTVTSPTGVIATVNTGVLNVRQAPSTSAARITQIKRNEVYAVLGRSTDGAWAYLDVAGTKGWAFARYLAFTGDFNTVPIADGVVVPPPPEGVVMQARPVGNMRIRACAGYNCSRIGFIPWGETVDILGQSADRRWVKLSYTTPEGNVIGWSLKIWFRYVDNLNKGLPSDLPVVQ